MLLGLFITADPIGYVDGMSLGQYLSSNPLDRVDPEGTDFIAVADRAVGGTLGTSYHYSLQYWQCSCHEGWLEKKDYFRDESEKKCKGTKKLESVEVLPSTGWTVWVKRHPWLSWTNWEWAKKSVWIAEIKYSDSATKVMPMYIGIRTGSIKKIWATIIKFAKSYRWAEQEGFDAGPTFVNWPRSMYKAHQTNSNTFVRAAVKAADLSMIEMDGWHPGNTTPSQNTDDSITGGPLLFFRGEKPWKD